MYDLVVVNVVNILYKIIDYYYNIISICYILNISHRANANSGLCEIFFLLLFICIIYISKLLYSMLG